jgi:hypothetical protein
MGGLLSLILSAVLGFTNLMPQTTSAPILGPTPTGYWKQPTNVCINEAVLSGGIDPGTIRVPKYLYGIKKPDRTNMTNGYEIPECLNKGGCNGPDTANYVLVSTNVKVDHTVFPNSFIEGEKLSDRQIVRQTDATNNPILADKYKNRIYRTFCGDWCFTCKPADVQCLDATCLKVECNTRNPPVELPFRGSFHCDFVYYLQDTDLENRPQIDENGNIPAGMTNPNDPNVHMDGAVYSVYFRLGATFPKDVSCDTKNELPKVTPAFIKTTNNEKMEYPPGSTRYWRVIRNPARTDGTYVVRNTELYKPTMIGTISNPLNVAATFNIYKNLVDPGSADLVYLVTPGTVENVSQQLKTTPPTIATLSYYLLERWDLHEGDQKSLKLGSFSLEADWIRKWVQESKPAIYLYPKEKTEVSVKLNPLGFLTVSDPPYDPVNGWSVIVNPDGSIYELTTNNQQPTTRFPYLYYEAQLSQIPNPKVGTILEISNIEYRISKQLKDLGLNEKEIKDYIGYWLPRLVGTKKPYFLVYFLSGEEIEMIEPIDISLSIDTSIRIRTYFKPLDNPISITEQKLNPFLKKRTGNVMVEWGGILDE